MYAPSADVERHDPVQANGRPFINRLRRCPSYHEPSNALRHPQTFILTNILMSCNKRFDVGTNCIYPYSMVGTDWNGLLIYAYSPSVKFLVVKTDTGYIVAVEGCYRQHVPIAVFTSCWIRQSTIFIDYDQLSYLLQCSDRHSRCSFLRNNFQIR